jgi:hypothetical protein
MEHLANVCSPREPWNKGKLVGQKAPFKLKEIWAIRVRLHFADRQRKLALFNLAIDSKLRACGLVKLRVWDVCHGQAMAPRAIRRGRAVNRQYFRELRSPCANYLRIKPLARSYWHYGAFEQAGAQANLVGRVGIEISSQANEAARLSGLG